MQNPENLRVYQAARETAIAVYLLTARFPLAERYGLVPQMRRAAVSVGSNMAEGCGWHGNRALLPFLHHSLGSLNELDFQADLAIRLGHCSDIEAAEVRDKVRRTRRMLARLLTQLRRRPDHQPQHSPS